MTANPGAPDLLTDLRGWVGLAAVASAAASLLLWTLMRLEAEYTPLCVLSLCQGAHIPGPFFLLWMMLFVSAFYLALAAAVVSVWGAAESAWTRTWPDRRGLMVIASGPVAVCCTFALQSLVADGVEPGHTLVLTFVSLLAIPFVVLGTGYLWVGLAAAGVLMLVRREGEPWMALGLIAFALASAVLGAWITYFNDGRLP